MRLSNVMANCSPSPRGSGERVAEGRGAPPSSGLRPPSPRLIAGEKGKAKVWVLILTLLAAEADAQSSIKRDPPPPPDYSREHLFRLFAEVEPPPKRERAVKFGVGTIEFRALGTTWRIGYLPFFRPFLGSVPTTIGTPKVDPFVMTGIEIPQTQRTWHDSRALNAELRRIEKLEKERAKLVVNP
jgi:hypothetical protein